MVPLFDVELDEVPPAEARFDPVVVRVALDGLLFRFDEVVDDLRESALDRVTERRAALACSAAFTVITVVI